MKTPPNASLADAAGAGPQRHHPGTAHTGSVTLVGAGPGDPDMLTVAAVKAIAAATVILVDDLVDASVLAFASRTARIVHVGKRGGCASTPQAFIERLMVQEARAGETVVRLKGGDPMLFGRGGEEVETLRAEGIPVRVVHGITAALPAASSLGVALTHRDHAHGVVFVTGHHQPNERSFNWAQLAGCARDCHLTLVIYMGIATLATIEAGLMQGLPLDTPVAVIENATRPTQRTAVTTLQRLTETVRELQLRSPAVLIVGDVLRGLSALAASAEDGTPYPSRPAAAGVVAPTLHVA